MRTIAVTLACLAATTAAHAHPGHLAIADGHSHWLALGAALAAAGTVVALAARGLARVRARRRALAAQSGEAA
jgi:hypothetical protein